MERRHSNYFETYSKEIKEISKKCKVEEREVIRVLEIFFDSFRDMIKDKRMPTILIPDVIAFRPQISRIRRYLSKYFYHYRRGSSHPDSVRKAVRKTWAVLKRLQSEKLGEKSGVKNHKKWHKIIKPDMLVYRSLPKTEED